MTKKISRRTPDAVESAEVVPSHLAPVPRAQARLQDWIVRTPASAAALELTEEATGRGLLRFEVDDAKAQGPVQLAQTIYETAAAVAAVNDRETRFTAVWYGGPDEGSKIVMSHAFRLGSNLGHAEQYDGTAISIIRQQQQHNTLLVEAITKQGQEMHRAYAQLMAAQEKVMANLQVDRESMRDRAVELEKQVAELSAQLDAVDDGDREGAVLDRLVDVASSIAAQHLNSVEKGKN